MLSCASFFFFFFNDTATTEIYTLSLHDALPIFPRPELQPPAHRRRRHPPPPAGDRLQEPHPGGLPGRPRRKRSEEHTSELQSRSDLVCRLLLEKKKKQTHSKHNPTTQDMKRDNT